MDAMAVDAKGAALRIIESMPDDATLDDIIYELYVRRKVDAGLEDVAAGRVVPHDVIEQDLQRWLDSSGS